MPYKDPNEQRRYQRERAATIRAKWLLEHGPCVRCGSSDRLQVDHVDPLSKISHNVWTWSAARREAELVKCQVLCSPCHFDKTGLENSQRTGGLKHGTDAMYGKGKCRCPACRQARKETKAANRARRKQMGLPYQ